MAVTVQWPDLLPLPTFQGYSIEPQDAILRTEMEAGPARQRERFTQTPTRISVRWDFTDWEFALFEGWYEIKAQRGALYFGITLLGGLGMVEHEARFMGQGKKPYTATPRRGGRWMVTSSLEIRERPVLSEGALEIALTEDVAALLLAIEALETQINQELPSGGW